MKRLSLIAHFLCLVLPFLAFSQEMVKVNILELYDKIPAPPADAKAAHARLVCVVENTAQRCDAEKFYQPINSELAALQQRVEKTLAALAQPSVAAMQKIDPQEMQKKMEKMTPRRKDAVRHANEPADGRHAKHAAGIRGSAGCDRRSQQG